MRAGDLRRKVSIQTRSASKDSYGQALGTWADLLTLVPADIQSLTGRELFAAQAVNSEVDHMIVVRYHPLLADPKAVAGMRVVYVNEGVTRLFDIKYAQNIDERNREINLMASEGLTTG